MKDSVLNVGFIGCGAIARKKHIPLAVQNPNLNIKAFFNRSSSAAELCKKEFGCRDAVVARDAEEIFGDDSIDLIIVATPNSSHAAYSIRALESGKHVICEKPMAVNAADAQRMLDASLRCGKMLHISYQNRYTNQALYAKRLVEEGILSNIYYAKAYAIRRRAVPTWGAATSNGQGGGPLQDIGSHAIDLALWLSGCFEPECALGTAHYALGKQGSEANYWGSWEPSRYEVEDLAVGLVRMKSGLTLSVEASYALNTTEEKEASVDLFGVTGGLELRQTEGIRLVQELGGRMVISRDDIQITPRGLTPSMEHASPSQREQQAVVQMLLDGKTYDPAAAQAAMVAKIVEGLYRSAATGRAVEF